MTKDRMQLLLLIGLFTVAAFVGLQFIFVAPGKTRLQNLRSGVEEKNKELRQKQGIARRYPDLVTEKESLLKTLQDYETTLITPAEFDFFRNTLRDLGSEYEVRVVSDRMITVPDTSKSVFRQDALYTEKEIRLSLTCRYHAFGGFLNRMEESSPFRKITQFTMSRRSQERVDQTLTIEVTVLSLLLEKP